MRATMRAKLLAVLLTAATALRPPLRMSAQLPATDPLRRRLFQGAAAVVSSLELVTQKELGRAMVALGRPGEIAKSARTDCLGEPG